MTQKPRTRVGRLKNLAERILALDPKAEGFAKELAALKASARSVLGEKVTVGQGPIWDMARQKGTARQREVAVALHRQVRPIIDKIIANNPGIALTKIAKRLDEMGIAPPRARTKYWGHSSVAYILKRPADWTG